MIWEIDDSNGVFLTFDDGPTPGVTEWILATLKRYDAKATFFVLGKNAEMYPDLHQRIIDEGHKIGNHTYSHQKGWGMPLEKYIEDVDFADDILHTDLFRPPYARVTPSQMRAIGQRYKVITAGKFKGFVYIILYNHTSLCNTGGVCQGHIFPCFNGATGNNFDFAVPFVMFF